MKAEKLISKELLLKPINGGIRLIRPSEKNNYQNCIADVFKLPVNVYFQNKNSELSAVNETAVSNWNFPSVKEVIGKTLMDFARSESAQKAMEDDMKVMRSQKMDINEEKFYRKDGLLVHAYSYKFPWFNDCNEAIGTFGFSVVIDPNNPLGSFEKLNKIIKMGLLNRSIVASDKKCGLIKTDAKRFYLDSNHYLTNRELECLSWLAQGNTLRETANKLAITPRTMKAHISNIKKKFASDNQFQLGMLFQQLNNLN